jgi:biotin operon repressor
MISLACDQLGVLFWGKALDLERSFGFLVNDVARLFGRRFSHNGSSLGLTRAQCRTLGYLARNEGINQAGLADFLEIRPMTLVRQIDRMEEAGRDFFARVENGYQTIAAAEPGRVRLIDGTASLEKVSAAIWRAVEPLLI